MSQLHWLVDATTKTRYRWLCDRMNPTGMSLAFLDGQWEVAYRNKALAAVSKLEDAKTYAVVRYKMEQRQ
jgi:hypothetical protein